MVKNHDRFFTNPNARHEILYYSAEAGEGVAEVRSMGDTKGICTVVNVAEVAEIAALRIALVA